MPGWSKVCVCVRVCWGLIALSSKSFSLWHRTHLGRRSPVAARFSVLLSLSFVKYNGRPFIYVHQDCVPPAFSDQSLAHVGAVGSKATALRSSVLDRSDARRLFARRSLTPECHLSERRSSRKRVLQGVAQMVMNMEEPVCSRLRRRPPPLSPGVSGERLVFAESCAANCTRDAQDRQCDSVYGAGDEQTFES